MGRIRTSQKDYDVETDDPKYLTLDTDKNQFKVVAEGEETFSLNVGNGYSYTKTVTHNLGYRPQVLAWAYYAKPNAVFPSVATDMVIETKFSALPYGYAQATTPQTASLVGSIDKGTTTVLLKFFQQTDIGVNFTLTNMKLFYIVYIDRE